MTVYQKSLANLGVRLEITHASPDIANNRTTITYKASVYKTGSHNPWNALSETPMYLTINGQSLYSTSAGNYNLSGSTYEQTIKSGTLVIPHNSDGSKSFSFSWNVNFTSTGYGYGNVTTSGTYVLPNIGRASTFTIPSTTITTGSAFTVSISRSSTSFTHRVSYIVGNNETRWTSNATTSYAATVPHSLFNSYRSTSSVSGVIRVTTMNGSSVVGSSQRSVTINLSSGARPTLSSVSYTNSNRGMFTNDNQFIRGISRPTAKAGTASGSYSSTISSYEYRIMRGSNAMSAVSRTTSSYQLPAFSFPNSGSENRVFIQMRVRDSRGRYSSWVNSPEIRVHYYTPPAIGSMTVRRVGSANTTLQVNRNYKVMSMFQSGGATNINNAVLRFQHRVKGSSTITNNTGAGSSTMSLSNSNANLSGTFATGTSYEVRAVLSDKLNTVYGSWLGVGTEFVPMDIAPRGVGVGKVHSNGSADLEVGSGGINSEGSIRVNGKAMQTFRITSDSGSSVRTASNLNNRVSGLEGVAPTTSNSPVSYGTVLGLNGFEILIGSDNSARFRRWSGAPATPGPWLNAMDKDGTNIPSSSNLNNYLNTGFYYIDTNAGAGTLANAPAGIMAGLLEVFRSGSMIYQKWTNYGATSHANKVFVRGRNENGNWYAWEQLAFASDIPSSATNSNGRRIRYANGVQICQGSIEFDTVSAGTLTFTTPFVGDPPVVTMTIQQPERWKFVSSSVTAVTLKNFTFNATNYDAIALTGKFKVNYIAYGRW